MRISFAITLLLVGTWCLIRVQPQCQGETAVKFEAFYVRMIRIGEDNYERFDEGTVTFDGVGKRLIIVIGDVKEFICYDPDSRTGYQSITVFPNGTCHRDVGYFFDLLVPSEDGYIENVISGGPGDAMSENIYSGQSKRERNEVILTTINCGPVEYAFSDQEYDVHVRMDLYNLTASLPNDAFKISCPGEQDFECATYPPPPFIL